MTHVVVIEAIGKISTIAALFKRRGERVLIAATKGHLYDLPQDQIAVDLETFHITNWEIQSPKQFGRVKSMLDKATRVTIMTDPDVEGEVIAHHLLEIIPAGIPFQRAHIYQLTDKGLDEALRSSSRMLNTSMVNKGLARRIADRVIGFSSSNTGFGVSLGRVVSPLLFSLQSEPEQMCRTEVSVNTADLPWRSFTYFSGSMQSEPERFVTTARDLPPPSIECIEHEIQQKSYAPYNYPDALNAISTRLGKSVKEVERALQSLYMQGRCTYIRTASRRFDPDAVQKMTAIAHQLGYHDFDPKQVCTDDDDQSAHGVLMPLDLDCAPGIREDDTIEQQCLSIICERLLMCGRQYELHTERGRISPSSSEAEKWGRLTAAQAPVGTGFVRQYLVQHPYREKIECHQGEPLWQKIEKLRPGVNVRTVQIPPDIQVLRRLVRLGLCEPSTIGIFADKVSARFLDQQGRLKPKAAHAIDHAVATLPQILNIENVRQLESRLSSGALSPNDRAMKAIAELLSSPSHREGSVEGLSLLS